MGVALDAGLGVALGVALAVGIGPSVGVGIGVGVPLAPSVTCTSALHSLELPTRPEWAGSFKVLTTYTDMV